MRKYRKPEPVTDQEMRIAITIIVVACMVILIAQLIINWYD